LSRFVSFFWPTTLNFQRSTSNVRPSIESALSPRRGKAHFPTFNKSRRKTVQRLESIIRNSLAINVDFFLRHEFCLVLYGFAFGSRGFTKMRSWESRALPVTNRAEHESSASRSLAFKRLQDFKEQVCGWLRQQAFRSKGSEYCFRIQVM
jgi:hypothetical protein